MSDDSFFMSEDDVEAMLFGAVIANMLRSQPNAKALLAVDPQQLLTHENDDVRIYALAALLRTGQLTKDACMSHYESDTSLRVRLHLLTFLATLCADTNDVRIMQLCRSILDDQSQSEELRVEAYRTFLLVTGRHLDCDKLLADIETLSDIDWSLVRQTE